MKKSLVFGLALGGILGLLLIVKNLISMYLQTSQYSTNHCYAELYRDISGSLDKAVSEADMAEVKRISVALSKAEFRYHQSCEASSERYRQQLKPN